MSVSLTVIATAALTATPVMGLASPAVAPPPRPPIEVCAPDNSIRAAGLAPEDTAALLRACAPTDLANARALLPPVRIEGGADTGGQLASSDDEPDSGEDGSSDDNTDSDDSDSDGNSDSDSDSGSGSSDEDGSESSGGDRPGEDSPAEDSADTSDATSDGQSSTGATTAPRTDTGGQQDRAELAAIAEGLAALLAESGNPRSAELAERLDALGLTGPTTGGGASAEGDAGRSGGNRTADTPAELLDVSSWKLTLPGGDEGDPTEILSGELESFVEDGVFHMSPERDGVVFRAEVGGATTQNSDYPRSELREMAGAQEEASWSNTSGTHTLDVRQAITEVPPVKPHVVAAQIHGGDDDILQIRLEDTTLAVQYNDGKDQIVIDPDYQLGTPYDLRIVAEDSRVVVFYDGEQVAELPLSGSGWYYKVGCYTQSNPDRGDEPGAAGEVVVYDLAIDHSGAN